MAGATYRIIVSEDGNGGVATDSTMMKENTPTKPRGRAKTKEEIHERNMKQIKSILTQQALALAVFSMGEYYSVTGQEAEKNRMNSVLKYGGMVGAGMGKISAGAIGTGVGLIVGAGIALGHQYYSFQKNITESNATAEYLRQQSNTSVTNNRGDYYRFSL